MAYDFGRLNDLCDRAYETSKAHGFWDTYSDIEMAAREVPNSEFHQRVWSEARAAIIAQKLALITSEVSEALEEHRAHGFESHVREDGKPEGWGSELADIFIRLGDLAVATGVNLEQEIVNKMMFNDTRPMKHGKRY